MEIWDLPITLILICTVIYVSTATKPDEKSLETPIVESYGNPDGAQDKDTVVTPPKDGNYKLSYADYELTWRNFRLEHNKKYPSIREERRRFAIFMKNMKIVESHNMKYHLGQSTYWMDINYFSDWTQGEINAWRSPVEMKPRSKRATVTLKHEDTVVANVPKAIDWRDRGYVTPAKYQGSCGSCYAFSATGAVEGQWKRKSGSLIDLSEQQIVDCSTGNKGCDGGHITESFQYIVDAGGLQNQSTYPYTATTGDCNFNESLVVATIESYSTVAPNEAALKSAVGLQGPVSVAIFASALFDLYKGGIFNDSYCFGQKIIKPNHAVLVVGYGQSADKKDYWIIKNCWGQNWGMNGFMLMVRNDTGDMGMCGIAGWATFPRVSDGWSNKLENNAMTVLVTTTFVVLKFTRLCF